MLFRLCNVQMIIVTLALVCSWGSWSNCATAADRLPNIIFILADDLGYGELGCYGQQKIKTPHIDKLATGGLRFTRAYSGNAVCAPSRCVLLTGRHPGHAYVRNNREIKPEGQEPLPAGTVTIGTMLRERGYTTGAFGKWGLGGPGSSGDPMNQGFDRFFGYNCQRVAHSYYPAYLWSNREKFPLNNNPPVPGHAPFPADADANNDASYAKFKGTDYAPAFIRDEALKFIDANKDKPFFLYYPTVIPHLALHVPDADLEQYHKLNWNDPPFAVSKGKGLGYTPHRTPRAAYAAMISYMDSAVGALVARLEQYNLRNDTLIIFTSDNGATHLKEEVDVDFFNSVSGLRGLKGELYEGGIRVPFIAEWPGRIAPGTTSDRVIGFEDVLASFAELSGATPPENDGISFVPTLFGKEQPARPFLYREFSSYGSQQAVWFGEWKAIRSKMSKGPIVTQLYNLATDPNEKTDVATMQPEVVKRAEALFKEQHQPSTIFPLSGID